MSEMTALRAHGRGGPEVLFVEQAPVPEPAPGEVLVAVHAAAITFDELTWEETWTHVPVIVLDIPDPRPGAQSTPRFFLARPQFYRMARPFFSSEGLAGSVEDRLGALLEGRLGRGHGLWGRRPVAVAAAGRARHRAGQQE